ncbi:MAG: glutamate 5-kinase [Chitinivibrionales bacterium]|nr:glutamate 5-kinase [Chitinivibrionales bacterium]
MTNFTKNLSSPPMRLRTNLSPFSTLVVKIGSRILAPEGAELPLQRIRSLVDDVVALKRQGVRVVLVSSGAIAHGMAVLGFARRPFDIPLQQACASIGQFKLMRTYESYFEAHDIHIGQVLLSWDDLHNKTRYLNLRNTLFTLLECGAVPIVNENDSVGIEEIKFGDNDTLGAQIAMVAQAEVYLILTDVDGLFAGNPHTDSGARHIAEAPKITRELKALASGTGSAVGTGGMITKLKAADIVTRAGMIALIGNGIDGGILSSITRENKSTIFLPQRRKMNARDQWIAFTGKSKGTLHIDAGACSAILDKGKSLLPAGICKIAGTFKTGDTVEIAGSQGAVIARGLTNYSSGEIELIRGYRTADIESKLGYKSFDEVIHRNNMVLL